MTAQLPFSILAVALRSAPLVAAFAQRLVHQPERGTTIPRSTFIQNSDLRLLAQAGGNATGGSSGSKGSLRSKGRSGP
jgi:hypothetical protein